MCPRDIVDSVGSLLTRSTAFGAFIGSTLLLIQGSQTVRQWKERIMRIVKSDYVVSNSMSSTDESVGLAFLFAEPLFLGFCVPILIPLTCVSVISQAVTYNVVLSKCDMGIDFGIEINISRNLISAAIMRP